MATEIDREHPTLQETTEEQVMGSDEMELSHDNEQSSLDFYGFSLQTGGDAPIAVNTRYTLFKKLEVINSKTINSMARWYNLTCLIGFFFSLTVVILTRTNFSTFQEGFPGVLPDATVYEFPKYFILISSILSFFVFAYAAALLLAYTIIIYRNRMGSVLNEQVWVFLLLVSTFLYFIPYEAALRIRRDFQGIPLDTHEDGLSVSHIFVSLRLISFSLFFILYPWMGAHSYRYLEERVSFRNTGFYLTKVIPVFAYVALKMAILLIYRVTSSELPLASFVAMLYVYPTVGSWSSLGVASVTIITIVELILITLVGIELARTFKTLRGADYTRYRTQILGFRFFLHQLFVFVIIYVLLYCIALFGLPNGIQIIQFSLLQQEGTGRGSYFDIQYAPFGLSLCILAYVTVEMYTNLPASCDPFKSLFIWSQNSSSKTMLDPEPISYKNTEPRSGTGETIPFLANCFVMETNVNLLNLSWYAYYHGTKKEKKLNVDFERGPVKIKISQSLYDEVTDTKTIIAESADRIFLVFKGTTSTQNLKTDLKVMHRPLAQVFDSDDSDLVSNAAEQVKKKERLRFWRRARVHCGFADAYVTVQARLRKIIKDLLQEKKRPLFFTGHSLGGALATLSSLDIRMNEDINEENIHVTTFGSPKVGNEAFQKLYDSHVPTNWRVVAGGDLISRLPTVGYMHVGKQVVLTSSGELFIDPNVLEMIFWHSQSASIVHHRKACYVLAMKAWCENLGGNYIPAFWPFPITENDSRLFRSTFKKSKSTALTSRISRRKQIDENRKERFQLFAEAIDALDDSSPASFSSLDNWKTLTTKLLQTSEEK